MRITAIYPYDSGSFELYYNAKVDAEIDITDAMAVKIFLYYLRNNTTKVTIDILMKTKDGKLVISAAFPSDVSVELISYDNNITELRDRFIKESNYLMNAVYTECAKILVANNNRVPADAYTKGIILNEDYLITDYYTEDNHEGRIS